MGPEAQNGLEFGSIERTFNRRIGRNKVKSLLAASSLIRNVPGIGVIPSTNYGPQMWAPSTRIHSATAGTSTAIAFDDRTTEVEINTETFKHCSFARLMSIGETAKATVRISGFGDVFAPVIDPGLGSADPEPHYYFTAAKDAKKSFPNIGLCCSLVDFVVGQEGSMIMYMQGVYLGRTEHRLVSINGDFIADVGYFGHYFGDPQYDVTRVIIPVFLGTRSVESGITSFLYAGASTIDDTSISVPFSTSRMEHSVDHALRILDSHLGAGVAVLQIGTQEMPTEDLAERAAEVGLAPELYTLGFVSEGIATTVRTLQSLQNLSLMAAFDSGYVLNSISGPVSEVLAIETVFPDVGSIKPSSEVKRLPRFLTFLKKESLTPEEIVQLPRVFSLYVSVTTHGIA